METLSKLVLTAGLEAQEVIAGKGFDYSYVLDLRCCDKGYARPVEEPVLKRLTNHFVEYRQMPISFETSPSDEQEALVEILKQMDGKCLVLTEEVSMMANLCDAASIPFESKVLYIVETGKGNFVKAVKSEEGYNARFGSFAVL